MAKGGKYGAYLFKNKDPAIDEFRTVVEDHFGRRVNHADLRSIEEAGGASVGAMSGWFFGDTIKPQNPALEACGRAIGMKRVWVAHRPNARYELPDVKAIARPKRVPKPKLNGRRHKR